MSKYKYAINRRKTFFIYIICIFFISFNLLGIANATSDTKMVGWRSSEYGYQQEAEPSYWINTANKMSSKFPNSEPTGIWVLGVDFNDGTCGLSFPHPEQYTNIVFSSEDKNEKYLQAFGDAGVNVWLQVEPANANVDQLIDLVLDQYKHHPSVIGFGIDIEWLESIEYPEGRPVTNEEAKRWIDKVKSHNPDYKLFLKHWDVDKMPTEHYEDIVFISDSLDFPNLDALIDDFANYWATSFPNSKVGFQIGYNFDANNDYKTDRDWWSLMDDPAKEIGTAIIDNVSNLEGIYWVDYSIKEVFPPSNGTNEKVIIFRDDDAQAWWSVDLTFKNITNVLIQNNISQTIGVIPNTTEGYWIGDDVNFKNYLNSIKQYDTVELALHGYEHTLNEFENITKNEAEERLEKGIAIFRSELEMTPTTFIPPYGTFNEATLEATKIKGFTKFSSIIGIDNYSWKESYPGLLHVPSTVDFYDWEQNRQRTYDEIITDSQSSLDNYDICVVLMHHWQFSDNDGTINQTKYNILLDVIDWVHEKENEGVKLMTIKQYNGWKLPPNITSFAPPARVKDTVCTWRTFNVSVDQTVNVSWYQNGSLLFTNESVREASCRLHAGAAGVHNVSAIASNANGSDMQTWIWNVTKAADLVITEKWLCLPDYCRICYNVTNIGNGTAPVCHNTTLYDDGVAVAHDHVKVPLAPGENYIGWFDDYTWTYTLPSDNITVCADNNKAIDELDETNNCLTDIWMCGDVNCDGKVTMSDVRKVFNRYLDQDYPLDLPWAADVNSDGKATMSDVRKVFNRYIDPGYELNCCCGV